MIAATFVTFAYSLYVPSLSSFTDGGVSFSHTLALPSLPPYLPPYLP